MRAKFANLNHCAVPFLSRAAANLCWYYYIYHYILLKNNCCAALSYDKERGLYFLAVVFAATIHVLYIYIYIHVMYNIEGTYLRSRINAYYLVTMK